MTSYPLRTALEHGMKNVQTANYDWMYDGVARHGAMEWTLKSDDDAAGLIRIVSAFEVPSPENDGLVLFELRGYACNREDRCSEDVTFNGSMPESDVLDKLVDRFFATVEALSVDELRPLRAR
ncbi:hypothetical protein [Streptomyces lasiicapitis]|uniref:Uncharacterized protein n=1 Tax=Streptomyces lasiicapitis TaxID=1923961 RepID=A0ABQ2MUI3_9ACTN|nr:hypothetical protein [Streptomyces lasiicapitis]GGO58898.1 hypothetical protein GCM10012286_79260 [Streptomyces lasiicapitis]